LPARVVVDGLAELVRQRAAKYDDIFEQGVDLGSPRRAERR
jgi:hypothetical protein